jgi:hypothetical protein
MELSLYVDQQTVVLNVEYGGNAQDPWEIPASVFRYPVKFTAKILA